MAGRPGRRTLLRQSVEVEVGEMRKQSHAEDLALLAAGGRGQGGVEAFWADHWVLTPWREPCLLQVLSDTINMFV